MPETINYMNVCNTLIGNQSNVVDKSHSNPQMSRYDAPFGQEEND